MYKILCSLFGFISIVLICCITIFNIKIEKNLISSLEDYKREIGLIEYKGVSCSFLTLNSCSIISPIFELSNKDKVSMDFLEIDNLKELIKHKEDFSNKNLFALNDIKVTITGINIKYNDENLFWNIKDIKEENKDFYSVLEQSFNDKSIARVSLFIDNKKEINLDLSVFINEMELKNKVKFSKDSLDNLVISNYEISGNFKNNFFKDLFYEYYKILYNESNDKLYLNNNFGHNSEVVLSKEEFVTKFSFIISKIKDLIDKDQSNLGMYINKNNQFINKLEKILLKNSNDFDLILNNVDKNTNLAYIYSVNLFLQEGKLDNKILNTEFILK